MTLRDERGVFEEVFEGVFEGVFWGCLRGVFEFKMEAGQKRVTSRGN